MARPKIWNTKMTTLNVYIPIVYVDILKQTAKDTQQTAGELVRQAIYMQYQEEIDQQEKDNAPSSTG